METGLCLTRTPGVPVGRQQIRQKNEAHGSDCECDRRGDQPGPIRPVLSHGRRLS